MGDRLISMKEVTQRVSLSKTTIYRRIKEGSFPRPVHLSETRIAFVEAEVDAWIQGRPRAVSDSVAHAVEVRNDD